MNTIAVAGTALEFARWPGTRPGPTLVLLHEGLGCIAMWKDFPAQVRDATALDVCTYSRAGHGQSASITLPRPLDFHTREALHVLPALLDAAAITSCVLIGHSDGASIAIIHAGAIADARVRALVLMAPHVMTETKTVMNISATKRSYEGSDLRARLARHHGDNVDNAFWGWCDAWLDAGFRQWNIEHHLPRIAVPVLTVRGVEDDYNTSRHVDSIAAHVTGAVTRLDLEQCGHAPHAQQRAQVLAAIAGFVSAQ